MSEDFQVSTSGNKTTNHSSPLTRAFFYRLSWAQFLRPYSVAAGLSEDMLDLGHTPAHQFH